MVDEIIKALELCGDENNCTKCPYSDKRFELDTSCAEELMRSAAEQMKRLKAENELLESKHREMCIGMKVLKEKAYKEFAKTLKAKASSTFWEERKYVDAEDIDDVLAELTHHKQTVSMIDGHIEE